MYNKKMTLSNGVISDEDMEALKQVKKIADYGESSGFPVFGGKI